jgi:hypothetical protein
VRQAFYKPRTIFHHVSVNLLGGGDARDIVTPSSVMSEKEKAAGAGASSSLFKGFSECSVDMGRRRRNLVQPSLATTVLGPATNDNETYKHVFALGEVHIST